MTIDLGKVYELELDYEHWSLACDDRLRNLQVAVNGKTYPAEIVQAIRERKNWAHTTIDLVRGKVECKNTWPFRKSV